MRRVLISFFLVAVMGASLSFADQYYLYPFSQSADVTSEELSLPFQVEKVEWGYIGLKVWGSVRNTDSRSHRFVKVIFTVKDGSGQLMTREETYTRPHDIGPGQVGYIEGYSLSLHEEPASIEYKVAGR